MTQPQQRGIQAMSVTYTTIQDNTGSLTHWARPGIEPASLWILVGFVSIALQWELPTNLLTLLLFAWNIFHISNFSHFSHFSVFICIIIFFFLWPHLQHMEDPRLSVELELRLPAHTTAAAMPDPSHVCDLHHSSRQCRILNPRPGIKPASSWMLVGFVNHWTTTGTP